MFACGPCVVGSVKMCSSHALCGQWEGLVRKVCVWVGVCEREGESEGSQWAEVKRPVSRREDTHAVHCSF